MTTTQRRTAPPPCDHVPETYQGPSRDEVLALRRRYVSPAVFTYYREPIQIVDGHMQYLWDDQGRRYLDAIAGIVAVSVGHCHPDIVRAVREQTSRLMHTTTIYLHPNLAQYAARLAGRFPEGSDLSVTYFTNSGSESNDLATLMARLHTGLFDIITVRNGYHGGTQTTMGLTAMGNWKHPLPHSFGVRHAAPGYCYRCPFGLEYPSCDVRCAKDVARLIEYETCGRVAAFLAEPIQGAGGVIDPPPEYFRIVYEVVRAAGGLCIADEVQTGFGRLGSHFWGFERYGVTPDIVVMAKGIANGAPLGAVTTRPDVAESLHHGLHFNTFGGNPVSMIQALTTLDIIEREDLQRRALEVGGYLKGRLLDLQRKHRWIGDVRGQGLLLGVELVRDRKTKEPAGEETARVHEGAKDRGLLIGRGGVYGNVLRIKPPLCITREDCDFLADCLDETLSALKT
ncbi:MAG: aspartate aminotransferase family protein [Planctomycetota bacterium]|nr:MAG: aspartate aminotransferase family protein [Planctomycetota bacterium]